MRITKIRAPRSTTAHHDGRDKIFAELDRRATEKELDGRALARTLGYTVSYIAKLRKGTARLDASPGFLRAVASFLGVSPLEIFVLAGFVEPKDFGPAASFAQYLDLHYATMAKDPLIAPIIPSMRDWGLMPLSGKLCVIGLYQVQRELGESLAAQREEGPLINLRAMRAAVDDVITRTLNAPNSNEARVIKALRKQI
jgi:transcriptional regulator with XRE-family HTH domain